MLLKLLFLLIKHRHCVKHESFNPARVIFVLSGENNVGHVYRLYDL